MTKRKTYMDALNILAIFAVVELHSSQIFFQNKFDSSWILSSIIQGLFIWATLIFFMLSGANLLNYRQRYSTKVFFKKRFVHVVIPFLFWSLIWYMYDVFIAKSLKLNLYDLVTGFAYNKNQQILWFFYAIIGFYLAAPLLSLVIEHASRRLLLYAIFLYFILTPFSNYLATVFNVLNPAIFLVMPFFSIYLGYFLVGWYLDHYQISSKLKLFLIVFGIAMGIGITILYTYFSVAKKVNLASWDGVTGFPVFFLTISIFLIVQTYFENKKVSAKLQNILKSLSKLSLGVYVIHDFVIFALNHFLNLNVYSKWYMILMPFIIYPIAAIIVFILKRVPIVRNLVP